jgi:3-oxoacyl-(acyl-carrier-protein) synthase
MEAVRSLFSATDRRPFVLSSRNILGEIYAAAPVMDAIIAIHIMASSQIPKGLSASQQGNTSAAARVLVHAASYEGQCASMVIESLAAHN